MIPNFIVFLKILVMKKVREYSLKDGVLTDTFVLIPEGDNTDLPIMGTVSVRVLPSEEKSDFLTVSGDMNMADMIEECQFMLNLLKQMYYA